MNKYRIKTVIATLVGAIVYIGLVFALLHAEKNAEGSGIQNFPDALWYSVVTLTTVGYGDFYPTSRTGRIIGYLFVFSSLGVLGFLIGKVNAMIAEYRKARHYGYHGSDFTNHIVILGWDEFAISLTRELVHAKIPVAIVTDDRNQLELIKETFDKEYIHVLLSDLQNFQLIEKTNINRASSVFINIKDDTEKLVYFINASKYFNDSLDYVVTAESPEFRKLFEDSGLSFVLSVDDFASKIIASYIFEPAVGEYFEDLLSSAVDASDFDIKQYKITAGNPYIHQDYDSVFYRVKEDFDAIAIGMVTVDDQNGRTLHKNPKDQNLTMSIGDYLIMIVNGRSASKIESAFNTTEGSIV